LGWLTWDVKDGEVEDYRLITGAPMMSFRFKLVRFRFAKMCAWYNE
jgi:hypothetical protein